MQAFTKRPPVDLRVNTLKSNQGKVAKALSKTNAKPTEIARNGLRIEAGTGASRQPNVQADGAFQKGWFEVQDEGSQIVAALVFARPGEQVLDFCAGAGGKTLALAASMENKGQIHAYDANKHRLKPIFERTKRAGIRNAQIHSPDSDMSDLVGAMDRVVVDAPCTGTGTWRRHPHAKWKLTKEQLEQRLTEQEEALSEAAPFVKVGGYLIYITCSVLPEENENQVQAFITDNPEFELLSVGEVWQDLFGFDKLQPWSSDMKTVTLTPASTNTDGFYFAVMAKNA
jgi:16S rRNA (cytosine967-C5)-methyltransferase